MKFSRLKYSLACLGAGAAMVLALPPFNLWPFMFAGFSAFYILISPPPPGGRVGWGGLAAETDSELTSRSALPPTLPSPRRGEGTRAFTYGWLFGFGYFGAGLWWIANALLVDGNPFVWVWPFAIAGLPALLGFFPALCSFLCLRFMDMRRLAGFLAFIAAFALSEWLRGHIFTGFPWNLYGYAWSGWLPMTQIVSVGGSYFLTLLTIFWAVLPGFLFVWPEPRRKKIILLSIGIVMLAGNALYGYVRLAHYPTAYDDGVAVRPVQANIAQADKWNPDKTADNLRRMLALSGPDADKPEPPLTLIVWPETALEYDVLANEKARALIRETLARYKNKVYLITGLLRYEPQPGGKGKYFNSLVVLDRDLNLRAVYNKAHLVPFGEYIPFQKFVPLTPFVQFQGFTAGGGLSTLAADGAPPFSPLICYEVIFPGAVVNAGEGAEWMVNITNDAWYGDSPGPRQHFAMARFRAIEEGLPVVRSAETGISGVIDPLGRAVYEVALNHKDARSIGLPRPLAPTLYVRISDSLFFAGLALFALGALMSRRKNIL